MKRKIQKDFKKFSCFYHRILSNHKGFSLLEVLIATLIFIVVTGAVISIFVTSTDFFEITLLESQLSDRLNLVVNRIGNDLKKSYREKIVFATASNFTISYNMVTGWVWNTAQAKMDPIYGPTKTITWDSGNKKLTLTESGITETLMEKDIQFFTAYKISLSTQEAFVIQIRAEVDIPRTVGMEKITKEVKRKFYVLPEPKAQTP